MHLSDSSSNLRVAHYAQVRSRAGLRTGSGLFYGSVLYTYASVTPQRSTLRKVNAGSLRAGVMAITARRASKGRPWRAFPPFALDILSPCELRRMNGFQTDFALPSLGLSGLRTIANSRNLITFARMIGISYTIYRDYVSIYVNIIRIVLTNSVFRILSYIRACARLTRACASISHA